MQYRKLADFFAGRRDRGEPLVLATVVETRGSTYSKAGALMLIDANGVFQGMLSGGCLEGDLAIRARTVADTGRPAVVSYDLSGDDDELWGLGVGCDGAMRILLQPTSRASDYQPFAALAASHAGSDFAAAALVVDSTLETIAPGALALRAAGATQCFGLSEDAAARLTANLDAVIAGGGAALCSVSMDDGTLEVLTYPVDPLPRLLVLGAGLDAEPLVRIAAELGWRTTVADHRPHYVDSNDFAQAERTLCCPADEVAQALDLDDFDLAIVMSHHLASDRSYLGQLAATAIGYVGLLGPPSRRARLVAELGAAGESLAGRLHGPAGLDLGGRGPAAIALSIAAGMQKALTAPEFRRRRRPRTGSSE